MQKHSSYTFRIKVVSMFAAIAFKGGNGVGTGWEHAHMCTPRFGSFSQRLFSDRTQKKDEEYVCDM